MLKCYAASKRARFFSGSILSAEGAAHTKPGASPQEFEIGRKKKRCKRVSVGRTNAIRMRGEARLQRLASLTAMNPGTLSQAIIECCALGANRLSRSAAMDRQRRRSDRNRELAELRWCDRILAVRQANREANPIGVRPGKLPQR
jgi:hypothetical protein